MDPFFFAGAFFFALLFFAFLFAIYFFFAFLAFFAFFFAAMSYLLLEFRSVLLPSQSQARTHLHPTTTMSSIRGLCAGSQGTIAVLEIFF